MDNAPDALPPQPAANNPLQELRNGINMPAVKQTGKDLADLATDFGKARADEVLRAATIVGNHVTSDVTNMQDPAVPTKDKVLTGLKYVGGAIGVYWVGKQLHRLWTYLFGGGFLSRMVQTKAAIAALLFGARAIAGKKEDKKQP